MQTFAPKSENAQKCEPFGTNVQTCEPLRISSKAVPKSLNPLQAFPGSANPLEVLGRTRTKLRSLSFLLSARGRKCEPSQGFGQHVPRSANLLQIFTESTNSFDNPRTVQSEAKTSNHFIRARPKSNPPHDRPENYIFMISL